MPSSHRVSVRKRPRRAGAGALRAYRSKRNLRQSGEPDGAKAKESSDGKPTFAIQRHDASSLHFDLRLEVDGVLRSWAVPKGLPDKPGKRSLAIEVEDHPLEYGSFEGVIPEGNYGAGSVMLWDRGNYEVGKDTPAAAYRAGKMRLTLSGEKCRGDWTLVRIKDPDGDQERHWLVIKNTDSASTRSVAVAKKDRDRSVLTGRTQDEIAAGKSAGARNAPAPRTPRAKPKRPSRAPSRKAEEPRFIEPMKAIGVTSIPEGEWSIELKYDGFRALAVIDDGEVVIWSRNRKRLDPDYPEIVSDLQRLRCKQAILDGEIVALDERGRSRFQLLQARAVSAVRPPIVFAVFDVLERDGISLMDKPLEKRRTALAGMLGRKPPRSLQLSAVFDASVEEMLKLVKKEGLEGIIAKAVNSRYEPGRRSGAWLKCKVLGEQEFVVGGYTKPQRSRPYFGAVLVGYREGGEWKYAGKVGTGFSHAQLKSLHQAFVARRVERCPFANLPSSRRSRYGAGMTATVMKTVTWLKPELVAQVRFAEWTDDGLLRQPVFVGLRPDKKATEVVREAPPIQVRAKHS